MSWVTKGMVVGVVGLGALLVMSRTGGTREGLDPKRSPLRGATYAASIPLVAGARLEDEMGGSYADDLGGPITFTSHSWFFTLDGTAADAAEFYARHLPPDARREETDDGDVAYSWRPPGSAEGEEVSVRIGDGRLQITEVVKARPAA